MAQATRIDYLSYLFQNLIFAYCSSKGVWFKKYFEITIKDIKKQGFYESFIFSWKYKKEYFYNVLGRQVIPNSGTSTEVP